VHHNLIVMRIFHEWLKEWRIRIDGGNKVFKELDDMSHEEMDFCFHLFFVEVRKQKGGELYPPRTLKEKAAGLQHYINYTLKNQSLYSKMPVFCAPARHWTPP
jgi:hypothetical protein